MAWFMSKRKCANKPEGKWILQFLAFLLIATTVVRGPAPGDADEVCLTSPLRPLLVNQDILMASFNYGSLVEGSGGPWAVVDLDGNNNEVAGSRSPIVSFEVASLAMVMFNVLCNSYCVTFWAFK